MKMPPRGNNSFREADIRRAVRCAREAGIMPASIEITCKDGTRIKVSGSEPASTDGGASGNPWDEVLSDAAHKDRPA
jgi:hypothetical protein